MNKSIKSDIKTKNFLYKRYIQSRKFESDFVFFETFIIEINLLTLIKLGFLEVVFSERKGGGGQFDSPSIF